MRNTLLISLILLLGLIVTACKKDIEDPDGTVTYSYNYTAPNSYVSLWTGSDEHIGATYPYATIRFEIRDASLNFSFTSINANDINIVSYVQISPFMGGEMVDIGSVKGLAEVEEKPSSGWVCTAAVQVGHGYVLRYKHAYDYGAASELPYFYARAYVDSWVKNTQNEIIGAKIKYQQPF